MKCDWFYYEFEDGYWCYFCGKPSQVDLAAEIRQHGKVVSSKVVRV